MGRLLHPGGTGFPRFLRRATLAASCLGTAVLLEAPSFKSLGLSWEHWLFLVTLFAMAVSLAVVGCLRD
jgi:hypothetical protein